MADILREWSDLASTYEGSKFFKGMMTLINETKKWGTRYFLKSLEEINNYLIRLSVH